VKRLARSRNPAGCPRSWPPPLQGIISAVLPWPGRLRVGFADRRRWTTDAELGGIAAFGKPVACVRSAAVALGLALAGLCEPKDVIRPKLASLDGPRGEPTSLDQHRGVIAGTCTQFSGHLTLKDSRHVDRLDAFGLRWTMPLSRSQTKCSAGNNCPQPCRHE